jgi:flagellin-like protein
MSQESASSPIIGTILIVAITIILAILVLLMFHMPQMPWENVTVPVIFKITNILNNNEFGQKNYDSHMIVKNIGSTYYMNWNLYVLTYVDGVQIPAEILTLNAYDQIRDPRHHGIQKLSDQGSKGNREKGQGRWSPGASLSIYYKHGTFHPGDMVMIEVYDNTTKKILSRDQYRV